MPIDVQDAELNAVLNGCLLAMAAAALLSLLPLPLAGGRNRWTLGLPWAALGFYIAYEAAMPARMDIRLDLVLILPLLALAFLAWAVRLLRLRRLRRMGSP